jgi:hypothetical protein
MAGHRGFYVGERYDQRHEDLVSLYILFLFSDWSYTGKQNKTKPQAFLDVLVVPGKPQNPG